MYALDKLGYINFVGIMCDDDKPKDNCDDDFLHFGDPSVQSIAQLNYITGNSVPMGVGSKKAVSSREKLLKIAAEDNIGSVNLLVKALKNTKTKVDIHMCGCCRDVLIAATRHPDLFKEKCGGIFLNAGTYGAQEPLEYNVTLEPYAFSQIFNIPCDIYWGPCFEVLTPYPYSVSERATYYELDQREMLSCMSDNLKKYFTYMYEYVMDEGWLSFLRQDLNEERVLKWADMYTKKRQMWSTPGYLKSAGKSVDSEGNIIDLSDNLAVFDYTPVEVQCEETGHLIWKDVKSSNIYMFKNTNPQIYANAMKNVIKTLYSTL